MDGIVSGPGLAFIVIVLFFLLCFVVCLALVRLSSAPDPYQERN